MTEPLVRIGEGRRLRHGLRLRLVTPFPSIAIAPLVSHRSAQGANVASAAGKVSN